MTTSAFGEIPEKRWDDGDRIGWEPCDPFGETPESLWDSLPQAVREDVRQFVYSLALDIGALRPSLPDSAANHILTAAANDAAALLRHVDHFDGRSAAHAARAVIEHLVNLRDISSSVENTSERYLDHRFVTANQVSRHRWHLQLLNRRARGKEIERLDRLGRLAARPLAAALARWGGGFSRGWATGSLFDRAAAHGLSEQYEAYRILSGVIHGSAGGLAGLVRDIQGTTVHRFGPDMELAAMAYREGLLAVYLIADHLVSLTDQREAERLRGLTANLLHDAQLVAEALRREDRKMWPTVPSPPPYVSVAGIFPSGRVRWYVHDTMTEMVALADPPEQVPDQLAVLTADVVESGAVGSNGRPVSAMFANVSLTPRADATWVPAASVLVPPGHPGRLKKPIVHKRGRRPDLTR